MISYEAATCLTRISSAPYLMMGSGRHWILRLPN